MATMQIEHRSSARVMELERAANTCDPETALTIRSHMNVLETGQSRTIKRPGIITF